VALHPGDPSGITTGRAEPHDCHGTWGSTSVREDAGSACERRPEASARAAALRVALTVIERDPRGGTLLQVPEQRGILVACVGQLAPVKCKELLAAARVYPGPQRAPTGPGAVVHVAVRRRSDQEDLGVKPPAEPQVSTTSYRPSESMSKRALAPSSNLSGSAIGLTRLRGVRPVHTRRGDATIAK
jgi:hypothetical protein